MSSHFYGRGKVMINKSFIEESDKLIALFYSRKIAVANGNLIVAKVKADEVTSGGIVIPKKANEIKNFHNGLARIIAVADNADEKYMPGMYVIHSHEARYKISEEALREFLKDFVNEDTIYSVQDNNVILHIEEGVMHIE